MTTTSTTRDEILRSAHTLLLAGGYNSFSYADISKVIGIRNASIHHHFPSKASLVHTLVAQYRETAQHGIADMERTLPDPLQKLHAFIRYWETCVTNNTTPFCLCALLAIEIPVLPEEVAREVRAYFQSLSSWLTSILEQGQKQKKLHLTHAPKVEAEILMAAVHGALLSARAYGTPKIFATITHPLLDRLTK